MQQICETQGDAKRRPSAEPLQPQISIPRPHAVALDRKGKRLLDSALPNDETKLRTLIGKLKEHGQGLLVVDQPATVGALPVAVARDEGVLVAYLPGSCLPDVAINSSSAMFLSAFAALRDPVSRAYYARKINQGKRHKKALIALARRRRDVLLAMLRDGTFLSPPRPQMPLTTT